MKEKLRIGILIDSFEVSAWKYAMIERIVNSDYAKIELIVLNSGSNVPGSVYNRLIRSRKNLIYCLYKRIDETVFRSSPNAFANKNIGLLLPDVPTVEVAPIQKKYFDYFRTADVNTIKRYHIHVLIRLGFRILKGDIFSSSEYGIWSYHHGDNTINRGGPAGFWEVVNNLPETGSTLQILSKDSDDGKVIYRSWARTYPLSPAKNRNRSYWKSLSFVPRKLEELSRVGEDKFLENLDRSNKEIKFYTHKLYKEPHNINALQLAIKQLSKIAKRGFQKAFLLDQWFLMFDLGNDISTEFRGFKKIFPPKDRFWADPHVIFWDSKYYVFIEELMYKTLKGHIAVIEMDQRGNITKPVKILEKDYHLSYPFVFEWEGNIYMIPESSQNKTIELYACVEFPHKWDHKMNLMENVISVDTTLLYYNERWWLFTNIVENEGAGYDDELFLFYSDNLFTTQWNEHESNPIVSDVKRARPAGKLFIRDGKVYRPSQDGSQIFGHGFNLNEIVVLTETDFVEETIASVKPNWDERIKGVHTFTYEKGLTFIDGFMRRQKLF
ncbi:hypothetical protein ISS37_04000 [candidate division KSB1 bacterium]|nr:hypothetical protein [candidate division KSB1 bacterium]